MSSLNLSLITHKQSPSKHNKNHVTFKDITNPVSKKCGLIK